MDLFMIVEQSFQHGIGARLINPIYGNYYFDNNVL